MTICVSVIVKIFPELSYWTGIGPSTTKMSTVNISSVIIPKFPQIFTKFTKIP
uniref:Uncharacterized protein n=1 Tax=Oryza brachyantha TaxID=4533 RepID=J3N217_ORYBR